MDFLFSHSFEIALGTFLIMWLFYRRNGTWQRTVTAHYQDRQIIQEEYDEVFRAAIDALNYCEFTIEENDYREGLFRARASWTMKSFGEYIIIKMKDNGSNTTVGFHSRCKLETQIFDWGKNRQNAENFFTALKKLV